MTERHEVIERLREIQTKVEELEREDGGGPSPVNED